MNASALRLTAEMVGDRLVISIPVPAVTSTPADDLVDLAACGLEMKAAARLRKAGKLPCVRIGRRWYTTRAALVALVTSTGSASELSAATHTAARTCRAPGRRRATKQNPEGG